MPSNSHFATLSSEFGHSGLYYYTPSHARQFYKHHPCPRIHDSADGQEDVSDSESGPESPNTIAWISKKDQIHPARLFLTRAASSASSSEPSPVSDVFTELNLPDDSISDMSSVMGSYSPCADEKTHDSTCGITPEIEPACGEKVEVKVQSGQGELEAKASTITTHRALEIPTLVTVQAGLFTAVPLTSENLQRYICSYQLPIRSKSAPERPRPKPPLVSNHKSGWARMQESTRRMEREAAFRNGRTGAKAPSI